MKSFANLVIVFFLLNSCQQNSNYGKPISNPNLILANFNSYWNYTNKYVKLERNFIALDENKNVISKNAFLKEVINNNFLPLKLQPKDSNEYYLLYKMPQKTPSEITNIIKQITNNIYKNFLKEGSAMPKFNFSDIEGNSYNNENTKGKIIVIKCWFIHCTKCIEEFPYLNKLVEGYEYKKDVLFLSLAIDSKSKLQAFLKTKKFNYSVIADKLDFMKDSLNVTSYPTHILINKIGVIEKIVGNYEELIFALTKI
ncbi:MAG: TlpA disulfide reductase family protein [Ferruginibacter sp.]|nr:TlpA family protein disulfide reductase [Ferruginibacter sp.]